MTDGQKLQAVFVGTIAALLLSAMALGVAYSKGRVSIGSYVQALEGDRNWNQALRQQCTQQLQLSGSEAVSVRDDAARLLDNLLYAMDGGNDPLRPSLSDARWEAEQRIKEWQRPVASSR